MSKKELSRLEVMKRLEEKRLKQKEAAVMLGVSETWLPGDSTKIE
jgi:predicted XRE-type DNA-binding protein